MAGAVSSISGWGTVLVVRRQARDSDGDRSGPPVDTVTDGWEIAPASSSEPADPARDTVVTRLQAFGGPPNADIGADDRVFLAGEARTGSPRWRVIGDPEQWPTDLPGWGTGGRVVLLERTTS